MNHSIRQALLQDMIPIVLEQSVAMMCCASLEGHRRVEGRFLFYLWPWPTGLSARPGARKLPDASQILTKRGAREWSKLSATNGYDCVWSLGHCGSDLRDMSGVVPSTVYHVLA